MEIEIIPFEFGENYLWKFMDIHKFLYFVYERSLYFTRLDKFDDPNEGLPEFLIRQIYEREIFPEKDNLNPALFPTTSDREKAHISNQYEKSRLIIEAEEVQKIQYANCWFIGNRESYAMWNLYSTPDSIAIRIKPKQLIDCIQKETTKISDLHIYKIICGKVDYNKVYPPEYDMEQYQKPQNKYSAFKKDASYKYENEYRFIAISENIKEEISQFELKIENLHSIEYKVITHPLMENWMYNNIQNILENFKLRDRLMRSQIKLKPIR